QRESAQNSHGFLTCHLSLVTCHLSLVTCHLSLITRDSSLVISFDRHRSVDRREANDRLRVSELDCPRLVFPGAPSLRASRRPAIEGRMSRRLDTGPAPVVLRNSDGKGSIDGMRLESR